MSRHGERRVWFHWQNLNERKNGNQMTKAFQLMRPSFYAKIPGWSPAQLKRMRRRQGIAALLLPAVFYSLML